MLVVGMEVNGNANGKCDCAGTRTRAAVRFANDVPLRSLRLLTTYTHCNDISQHHFIKLLCLGLIMFKK